MTSARRGLVLAAAWAAGCGKVPIDEVETSFPVATATWFEEEDTLFLFAKVTADQGLTRDSVLEASWRTDEGPVDWTPIAALPTVHTHLPVDCGPRALCVSASVAVPDRPRDVRIRLRWHREGELALQPPTDFSVVGRGEDWRSRSAVVYGVFDGANERVQWRLRHQFPTLRNEEVEGLGLRRAFSVAAPASGPDFPLGEGNAYGYGVDCPAGGVPTGWGPVGTDERAVFAPEALPLGASAADLVCADATVTDARGPYTTGAVARKNPEVRQAFPLLRSPMNDALVLPFFLGTCERTISADHEDMQRQRLQLEGVTTTCIDHWRREDFVPGLVTLFREAVEEARPRGRDMVLAIALNQDDQGVSEAVEEALAAVVPEERHRTTPRLAGAFVFDSTIQGPSRPDLGAVTLWCPATIPTEDLPDVSQRSCPVLPDDLSIDLGPFSFGTLPILPPRDQYLNFLDTYSPAQAGRVTSLAYRTPEFAATARHLDFGEFGVITFLNGERIRAEPEDAFSWCQPEDPAPFVFSSEGMSYSITEDVCAELGVPPDLCGALATGVQPLELLPDWHNSFRETAYDLGVAWDFPFLLRMEYETFVAGSVSAFGLSVPFGLGAPSEAFYGSAVWLEDDLPIGAALLQCDRWCDHPTFDSAAVYHPSDIFRWAYATTCYRPVFPRPGDGGFPLDP